MRLKIALLSACLAAVFGTVQVSAHHSFAAEFDADSAIDLTGTVTKVEWMNPHTIFYIDVETGNGRYDNWAIELGSPNGLMRRGWTRNSLKLGDEVTIIGSRARNGSLKGNARSVMLSTGQTMFTGTSEPDAEEDE